MTIERKSLNPNERNIQNITPDSRETVLVTGATGFLGGYLVRRLVSEFRVLALGRNQEKGRELEKLGAIFCPGDFTDRESCAKYFSGVQYVIHGGALSTVWGLWEDFYKTNVLGTRLVAKLCYENKVRRMVYISSPSIYTEKEDQYDIREEQAPDKNNLNYYIKSKLMAEKEIAKWHEKGLETVILRPRGLIGIGDTSLVPRLIRANNKVGIPLFCEGKKLVDLTCVENAALACRLAMTAKEANGQVLNITNGEPAEFGSLLGKFLRAAGETPRYRRLPFHMVYGFAAGLERIYQGFRLPGEPPLTRYTVCTLGFSQTMDIRRARDILGYQPEKKLDDAIEEYGMWWRREKAGNTEKVRSHSLSDIPPQGSNKPNKITRVVQYHCGTCTNNLAAIFRGIKGKQRRFPATVFLIHHRQLGYILYDTGYSETIFRKGILLNLYRLFNPVSLKPGQTIDERLARDGVSPESVKTVILSHVHPDHVGGLYRFSKYDLNLISSEDVRSVMESSGFFSLFLQRIRKKAPVPRFAGLVRPYFSPEHIHWLPVGKPLTEHFLCSYFDKVYDLFGDGSIIGVELDGHCLGQLGLWIPDKNLFLAADACWGQDLMAFTDRMRLIPRLIQEDFSAYKKTIDCICLLKHDYPDIHVEFSHQVGKENLYV